VDPARRGALFSDRGGEKGDDRPCSLNPFRRHRTDHGSDLIQQLKQLRSGIFVHNTMSAPVPRTTVRQSPADANRLFFDFDAAAPGGRGGASVRLDPGLGLGSIDGVHKNVRLPPRSTGGLVAEGLQQSGMPKPAILEGFNVEKTTANALNSGGTGQGTLIGNMLEDAVGALGGTISRWEPIKDGSIWRLRVHISYP
jgi:hypothetical protein